MYFDLREINVYVCLSVCLTILVCCIGQQSCNQTAHLSSLISVLAVRKCHKSNLLLTELLILLQNIQNVLRVSPLLCCAHGLLWASSLYWFTGSVYYGCNSCDHSLNKRG